MIVNPYLLDRRQEFGASLVEDGEEMDFIMIRSELVIEQDVLEVLIIQYHPMAIDDIYKAYVLPALSLAQREYLKTVSQDMSEGAMTEISVEELGKKIRRRMEQIKGALIDMEVIE